jgi:uncharacterized protein GlcG (DUF336 family)
MPISLALAKKVADAAEAEAKKTGFPSWIVIVGPNGETIFEERKDNSDNSRGHRHAGGWTCNTSKATDMTAN